MTGFYRVSRLLSEAGLTGDTRWFTEESRDRGRLVHWAGEQIMRGQAVEVAPAFAGYVQALRDGIETLGMRFLLVEQRLTDETNLVTGRPDGAGFLPKRIGEIPAGPCVLDIKSGDPYPVHGIQLALYERLVTLRSDVRAQIPFELRGLPFQRIGLYVRADGGYRIRVYRDLADYATADAVLQLTHWRVTHGLITPGALAAQDDDPQMAEVTV